MLFSKSPDSHGSHGSQQRWREALKHHFPRRGRAADFQEDSRATQEPRNCLAIRPGLVREAQTNGHRKDQPQSDMGSEECLTVLHFGGTQNNDGSRVDMICNCPKTEFNVLKSGEVKSMVNPKTDLRENRFLMHLPSKPPSNGMLRFLQIPGIPAPRKLPSRTAT